MLKQHRKASARLAMTYQKTSKNRQLNKFCFRLLYFIGGLVILSMGYALIIHAGLGSDTIGLLAQGISKKAGITIGRGSQIINLTAVAIVLVWDRKLTGVGTFITMFGIGFLMDLFLPILPVSVSPLINALFLAAGIGIAGIGVALTVISDMGASPIDCLMLLLSSKLKASIMTVRIFIDVIMAFTGWIIGGTAGIGTILSAILIGPVIDRSMKAFKRRGQA